MKIYIPTVKRPDNQITYNNLPDSLKKQVVFVVQAWEREQYHYNAEYLVLPDTPEYHYTDYYCLPKTRAYIYNHAKNTKYAVLDDDLTYVRRNQKYWGLESNMEKSKRPATEADILEMFAEFEQLLDEYTVIGNAYAWRPTRVSHSDNSNIASAFYINGQHFAHELDTMTLTSIRICEDACFVLNLLTRGYKNRLSFEFVINNASIDTKMNSAIWDAQTVENSRRDHHILQSMFPLFVKVVDDNTGYKGSGKLRIKWKQAYKQSQSKFRELFE